MSDIPNPTYPRQPGWEQRLTEFLTRSLIDGYSCDWNEWQCAKWSNEAVYLQNGRDVYEPFEGKVTDAQSAYKEIKKAGFESLEDFIKANFREKPRAFTNRGDLVFVPADGVNYHGLGMSHALGIADPPFFYALGLTGTGKGLLTEVTAVFDIEEDPA